MGSFANLLQNKTVEQIMVWQVAAQIIGPLLSPVVQQVLDETYPILPSAPTSPAELADQVVKNVLTEDHGADEAKHSGVNTERFHRMVQATGEPPGIMQLLEMGRRQIIPIEGGTADDATVRQGIRESHVKDKWFEKLIELQFVPLPVADAAEAVVKHHLTKDDGAKEAYKNGVKADTFDILVKAAGNPPSPMELLQLYRRGDIPLQGTGPDAISVEQGIYEGRTNDKWFPYLSKLAEYLPPPRTVTALLREGAITVEQAQAYFVKQGLPADLAAIYVHAGTTTKAAKVRELTEAQLLGMYEAHALTETQTHDMLLALGYADHVATELILYTDLRRELTELHNAVGHIRAQYLARKLSLADATSALDGLGLPAAQRDQLIKLWHSERALTVRVLTEAQIVDAWHDEIIDDQTADTYLEGLGYSPFDAWVLRSIKAKTPQPNPPDIGQNVPDRAQ